MEPCDVRVGPKADVQPHDGVLDRKPTKCLAFLKEVQVR